MEDLYKILEVERSATAEEIKAQYRKLAMKWHPDRNAGSAEAETKFKAISQAYAVLSDEQQRHAYDEQYAAWQSGGYRSGPQPRYDSSQGWQNQNGQYQTYYWHFGNGQAQREQTFEEKFKESFEKNFSREQATNMFMNEMYNLALELTMQNIPWRNIAAELINRGCPENAAREIARKIEKQRKQLVRAAAKPYFINSAFSAVLGFFLLTVFRGLFGIIGFFMCINSGFNLLKALYYILTGNTPRQGFN